MPEAMYAVLEEDLGQKLTKKKKPNPNVEDGDDLDDEDKPENTDLGDTEDEWDDMEDEDEPV